MVVRGTQRFRDRVPALAARPGDSSTGLLGDWYATVLRWRPVVALFVNEATLLPVFVSLAPAQSLAARFLMRVEEVLATHGVPLEMIDRELAEMTVVRVAPTASRSVVGVMNEFGYLAAASRSDAGEDLLGLSVRMAGTPCGPLYRRHVSPDRELAAVIASQCS